MGMSLKKTTLKYKREGVLWSRRLLKGGLKSLLIRDHPFKTSSFFFGGGGGVKNWPNFPTDSSKRLPTGGG